MIIQSLRPGPHRVLIELADPTHRVIDSVSVELEIPDKSPAPMGALFRKLDAASDSSAEQGT